MACEDFPCCGHESGCCPDFDESGNQLNMKCTCGATLPVDARCSICDTCMNMNRDPYDDNNILDDESEPSDYFEDFLDEEEGCSDFYPEYEQGDI